MNWKLNKYLKCSQSFLFSNSFFKAKSVCLRSNRLIAKIRVRGRIRKRKHTSQKCSVICFKKRLSNSTQLPGNSSFTLVRVWQTFFSFLGSESSLVFISLLEKVVTLSGQSPEYNMSLYLTKKWIQNCNRSQFYLHLFLKKIGWLIGISQQI